MKIHKKIILGLVSTISFSPFISLKLFNNSNEIQSVNIDNNLVSNNKTINEDEDISIVKIPSEEILESDQMWVDSLLESANSNSIKLFFTRNASLVYQQSLLAIQTIMNTNKNIDKQFQQEIGFFIDEDVYKNVDKFDYDILMDKDNILFSSNIKDIDNKTNEPYSVIPTENYFNAILSYYKQKFPNQELKFDLWIPDISLSSIWRSKNMGLFNMLPYVRRIYLLSDGNAQTYKFAKDYETYTTVHNLSEQKILSELNKILDKNLDEQTRYEVYKKRNFFDFVTTSLFRIFHVDRYVDSPYYNIDMNRRYVSYVLNYDYTDLANKLNFDEVQQENFIKNYESFFRITTNHLSDFVFDGFENYDPNKKNIIWIGDSLIREHEHIDKKRKNEIQNLFLALTKQYDPSEYNYFFKHHPYYTDTQQKELTNFITELVPNVKTIYFKNFPWELFLSWDRKQSSNPNYVPFFSPTSNIEEIPRTQLIGIQYTTTVVSATYNFNIKQNKMTQEQAWKSITNKNFPIPGTFDIVSRGKPSTLNYYEQVKINEQKIRDIYNPYLALNKYPYLNENILSVAEFLSENDIQYEDVVTSEQTHKLNILYAVIPIISLVVISSIVSAVWYYYKKKQNVISFIFEDETDVY